MQQHKTIEFGSVQYWDDQYKSKPSTTYDWLQSYATLKPFMDKHVDRGHRILMVGCGNSLLTADMHADGFVNIVSTDVSAACIEQMNELHKDRPELKFEVADVTDMSQYKSHTFDTIIDKGTLDALCCSDTPREQCYRMVCEMNRLLKPAGKYLCISFGMPSRRLQFMQYASVPFKITDEPIMPGETNPHYVYTCEKLGDFDDGVRRQVLDTMVQADADENSKYASKKKR